MAFMFVLKHCLKRGMFIMNNSILLFKTHHQVSSVPPPPRSIIFYYRHHQNWLVLCVVSLTELFVLTLVRKSLGKKLYWQMIVICVILFIVCGNVFFTLSGARIMNPVIKLRCHQSSLRSWVIYLASKLGLSTSRSCVKFLFSSSHVISHKS